MKLYSDRVTPFVGVAAVVALVGTTLLIRPPTNRFQMDGVPLTFNYPAGWTVESGELMTFGFGHMIELIGNVPWGPCAAGDVNCHHQHERFAPGQIEVEVGVAAHADICSFSASSGGPIPNEQADYLRIDGFPAVERRAPITSPLFGGATNTLGWSVAAPERPEAPTALEVYSVAATFREGSLPNLDLELDSLKASMHMDGVLLPQDDCGAPFPAA
jgi:hypothetical protein